MCQPASRLAVRYLLAALLANLGLTALPGYAAGAANQAATNAPAAPAGPRWKDLNPQQQQALAPLAGEWDKLDAFRKSKWLAIGDRYAAMPPEAQQRLQDRMREWLRLTPAQRRLARDSFTRAKKLDQEQKSAKWEQYQQLPEERKSQLAKDAAARKRVATLPVPPAKTAKPAPPAARPQTIQQDEN